MTKMNREFKKGDRVFDIRYGWGEVSEVNYNLDYPIEVTVRDFITTYTSDGRAVKKANITLSHTEYSINSNQSRVVEVSQDNKDWYTRVLHMVKNGKAICWTDAETIEDSLETNRLVVWNFWREKETEKPVVELTLEDISNGKGVGVPAHLIRIKK